MLIRNVTSDDIVEAVRAAGEYFRLPRLGYGNLNLRVLERAPGRENSWRVRLGVYHSVLVTVLPAPTVSARTLRLRAARRVECAMTGKQYRERTGGTETTLAPGASVRLTADGGFKRLAVACWHAHGRFFDALPRESKGVGVGRSVQIVALVGGARIVYRSGDPWQDFEVGGPGLMASQACGCERDWS